MSTTIRKTSHMSDKLISLSVGLAQEIEHALNRNGFQSLDEVKGLTKGDFLANVRNVQLGHAEIKPIEHAIDLGTDPFLPDGWKVEEHRKGKVAKLERKGDDLYLDGKKIDFYLSKPQKKRNVIVGDELRKDLAKQPVLNANVLDYLLKNPHLIPEMWKKDEKENTHYIFFWGTIYRSSDGRLCVRYLYWVGDWWNWSCGWLGNVWDDDDPAVVSAS